MKKQRAFFPLELEEAIKKVAAEYEPPVGERRLPLGEYWEWQNNKDPAREQKIDVLKSVLRNLTSKYFHKSTIKYDEFESLAYLLYYLPRNLHKIQFILLLLFENGLLPEEVNALDIGTGTGTVPLATADFYKFLHHSFNLFDEQSGITRVDFTCVVGLESNLQLFEKLIDQLDIAGSHFSASYLPATSIDPSGNWLISLPPGGPPARWTQQPCYHGCPDSDVLHAISAKLSSGARRAEPSNKLTPDAYLPASGVNRFLLRPGLSYLPVCTTMLPPPIA